MGLTKFLIFVNALIFFPILTSANQFNQRNATPTAVTNNYNFYPSNFNSYYNRTRESSRNQTKQPTQCQIRVDEKIGQVWNEKCIPKSETAEERLNTDFEAAKKCLMDEPISIEAKNIPIISILLPDICAEIVNGTQRPLLGFIINLMGYTPEKVKKRIDERKEKFLKENLKVPMEPVHIGDVACFEYLYRGTQPYAQSCFGLSSETSVASATPEPVASSTPTSNTIGNYETPVASESTNPGVFTCVLKGWKEKYGNPEMSNSDFAYKSLVEDTSNACSEYYRKLSPRPTEEIWTGQIENELRRIVENFGAKSSEIESDIVIESFNRCIANAESSSINYNQFFTSPEEAGAFGQFMMQDFDFFGDSVGKNQVAEKAYSKVEKFFVLKIEESEEFIRKLNVEKCERRRIEYNNIQIFLEKPNTIPPEVWSAFIQQRAHTLNAASNALSQESLVNNSSLTTGSIKEIENELRDFLIFYFYKSQIKGMIIYLQQTGEIKPNCIPDKNKAHKDLVINGPIEDMTNDLFDLETPNSSAKKKNIVDLFYQTVGSFKTQSCSADSSENGPVCTSLPEKKFFEKECKDIFNPEPILVTACTSDAQICADGSSVGRDSNNNCAFFSCPGTAPTPEPEPASTPEPEPTVTAQICEEGTITCANGTTVGRDPLNQCEYFSCGDATPTPIADPSPIAEPTPVVESIDVEDAPLDQISAE